MNLKDDITKIRGIGEKSAEAFYAAGIYTVNGLLHYFPRNYSSMPEAVKIKDITREGRQIYEGPVASLKRFKDDVKEVKSGYECGLVFEKFNDLQEEDMIEAFVMVEVPR